MRVDAKTVGWTAPRTATDDFEAAFRSDYLRYQYILIDFLAEHLADVSQSFDGDMQMVVLLSIIGQTHLGSAVVAAEAGRSLQDLPNERRGITTLRLSDASGIPRETVRRKLNQMERNGWLVRERNFWLLTMNGEEAVARKDLSDLDSRTIRRAARLFSALASLVKERK